MSSPASPRKCVWHLKQNSVFICGNKPLHEEDYKQYAFCQLIPFLIKCERFWINEKYQCQFQYPFVGHPVIEFSVGKCPSQAKKLFVSACKQMAYLHKQGITHGNLTPFNVLVSFHRMDQVVLTGWKRAHFLVEEEGTNSFKKDIYALVQLALVLFCHQESIYLLELIQEFMDVEQAPPPWSLLKLHNKAFQQFYTDCLYKDFKGPCTSKIIVESWLQDGFLKETSERSPFVAPSSICCYVPSHSIQDAASKQNKSKSILHNRSLFLLTALCQSYTTDRLGFPPVVLVNTFHTLHFLENHYFVSYSSDFLTLWLLTKACFMISFKLFCSSEVVRTKKTTVDSLFYQVLVRHHIQKRYRSFFHPSFERQHPNIQTCLLEIEKTLFLHLARFHHRQGVFFHQPFFHTFQGIFLSAQQWLSRSRSPPPPTSFPSFKEWLLQHSSFKLVPNHLFFQQLVKRCHLFP